MVLTDGRMVYKYFHYWQHRASEDRLAFLRSLAGRLAGFNSLPDIKMVRLSGDRLVESHIHTSPGRRYEGGRLDELLTLLHECREAGIACRNIIPTT